MPLWVPPPLPRHRVDFSGDAASRRDLGRDVPHRGHLLCTDVRGALSAVEVVVFLLVPSGRTTT